MYPKKSFFLISSDKIHIQAYWVRKIGNKIYKVLKRFKCGRYIYFRL